MEIKAFFNKELFLFGKKIKYRTISWSAIGLVMIAATLLGAAS